MMIFLFFFIFDFKYIDVYCIVEIGREHEILHSIHDGIEYKFNKIIHTDVFVYFNESMY